MSIDQMEYRLQFLVYGEDAWRGHVDNEDGKPRISYDAHGLTARQACRNVEDLARIFLAPVTLEVIHGYNHGTAIKDSLASLTFNDRLVEKHSPQNNPGVTCFSLHAA